MKNLKMKNFLLTILCAGCIGATTVGVTQIAVNAQNTQTTVSVAENLTTLGASVRLSEVTGIRFIYAVEDYDAVKNAETNYGMLIVPYDYLARAGISELKDGVDYVTVLEEAYKDSIIPNKPIVKTGLNPILNAADNKYIVQHSVGKVLESNYNRPWFALGFIANADGTYSYAKVGEKNVRDVLQVSSLALQDYYYNAELETESPDTYALYEQYESVMKNFVTTGIENVVGEGEKLTYAIEGESYAWSDVQTETTVSVTKTQYVNLPYRWTSSNEEVATIDATGKVTLVGKGTTTLKAESCNMYTATRTLNVYERTTATQEGEILYVTDDGGAQGFSNVSGYANFTVATDEALATLTGDYTGKAVTVPGKKNVPMQLGLVPRITEEDWDKAVENGYKNMYIWLTATWDVDSGGVMAMQPKAEDNTLQSSEVSLKTSGEWKKFTYELNDTNKAKLFATDNRARVIVFYPYMIETSTFYVGNCGFDEDTREYPVQEGEIAFIYNGTSVSNFKNFANLGDANVQPKLATEEDLAALSGDYTGKAVKIISSTLAGVLVMPRITEEDWDKAVAAGYTKMYIWFASTFSIADGYTSGVVQMQGDSSLQTSAVSLTSGVWQKFTYELTEENKAKLFADGGGRIARFYPWQVKDYCYYVGDCGFDEDTRVYPVKEGEIAFVNNKDSLGNYRYTVGQNTSTTSLATEADLGKLTGDYTGKAVKFEANTNYSRVFITPRITQADWDKAVAAGYTKLYYWVAVEDTSEAQNLSMQLKSEDSIVFSAFNIKTKSQWIKMSFDLTEENKAYLFADGGFKLFCAYRWGGSSFNLYIGDCGFEQ